MMGILNNFASIYCFITFVLGAMFMLAMIIIAAMGNVEAPKNEAQEPKNKVTEVNLTEPRNKVRFYVKRVTKGLELWVKDRFGNPHFLYYIRFGDNYLIDTRLFEDMKEGDIRYINSMEY